MQLGYAAVVGLLASLGVGLLDYGCYCIAWFILEEKIEMEWKRERVGEEERETINKLIEFEK